MSCFYVKKLLSTRLFCDMHRRRWTFAPLPRGLSSFSLIVHLRFTWESCQNPAGGEKKDKAIINATIIVERDSLKSIIIGRTGSILMLVIIHSLVQVLRLLLQLILPIMHLLQQILQLLKMLRSTIWQLPEVDRLTNQIIGTNYL